MIFHESRDNGWIPYRRNLVCHVEDGRMDGHDFMVLSMLFLLADSDSGTLKTCASALVTLLHCGLNERNIQKILDRLDKRDYLRRDIITGKRGLYLVTLNRFAITNGPKKGKRSEISPRIEPKTAQWDGTEEGVRWDPSDGEEVSEVAVRQDRASYSESTGSSILKIVAGDEVAVKSDPSGAQVRTDLSTIQHRYKTPKTKKEKEKKRVVVVKAKKRFLSSSPLSVLEEQGKDEEYVKGEDVSGSLAAHRDPYDALGQEYLPLGSIPVQSTEESSQSPRAIPVGSTEKSSQSATAGAAPAAPRPLAPPDPLDASFKPTEKSQPLGSQEDALLLVQHFLDLVQPTWACSDADKHPPDWIRVARLMLGKNSLAVLKSTVSYAMRTKYWRDALRQKGRDPFAFFEDRISAGGEQSLLAQSNNQPVTKQEPHHGKKTANPAATGRSAAPTSVDKARAIAEQAKQAGRR